MKREKLKPVGPTKGWAIACEQTVIDGTFSGTRRDAISRFGRDRLARLPLYRPVKGTFVPDAPKHKSAK